MKPEFPAVIDNSMLNDFRSCPQRAFRAHIEHWKGKGDSVHLVAGGAFARGLEVTRHAYYEEETDAQTAIARGTGALLEEYGTFECPELSSKSPERMAGALVAYFDEWPLDKGAKPSIMPSGRRAIEFSFAEPLPIAHPISGEPIIYAGRTDMICDFAGGRYLEDDKTTTALGDTWASKWELRSQFTGYCWAAREAGIDVNGVLVRGVSILKTKYGFAQAITYRSPWEIKRWLDQTVRDVERMIWSWRDAVWDWNLGDACDAYGGCQFKQVCKSPEPHIWLPMYFERRRWDPLERTQHLVEGEWTPSQLSDLSSAQSPSLLSSGMSSLSPSEPENEGAF